MTPAFGRVGLLGGTFDPVHNAHLDLAGLFAEQLGLDTLRFLPAGSPWQKSTVGAAATDRLAMLQMALEERMLAADIDERELHRDGPTYTVDSLREIRSEIGPEPLLVLLIGADQLLRLHTWSRWPELLDMASLAVGGRPSFGLELDGLDPEVAELVRERAVPHLDLPGSLRLPAGQIVLIPADLGETSSSAIRRLLNEGQFDAVRDLLPSSVLDYIRAKRLYTP